MTAVGAQPINRGLLIGDTEVPAASGRTTDHLNPVTGEVHSRMAAASKEDVDRVVSAAHAAFPVWAGTPASQRRLILERAAQILSERVAEFTEVLVPETGGTRGWAAFNISMSVELLRQAATMATEPTGRLLATDRPGELSMAIGAPAGVCVAFVPWNGPLILCTRAVAVALATGNPVVIRPSEDAPITSGYFLADVLREAGVPAGVVTVITNDRADAPEIVEALIAHPHARRINFTGSTTVGKIVGRHAGTYLKPVILELGGKNPIVVLDDADLDYAARGIATAKFFNAGQICLSVDRIIVLESVADEFTEKFLAAVDRVGYGDPTDPRTMVGPMINDRAAQRVIGRVLDMLIIDREVDAFGDLEIVVELDDAFGAVFRQLPVTDQDAEPAGGEIAPCIVRDVADHAG